MWSGDQIIRDPELRALYMPREPVREIGFGYVYTPPEFVRDVDSYFCARIQYLGATIPGYLIESLRSIQPEYQWPSPDSADLIRQDIIRDRYMQDEVKCNLLKNLELCRRESVEEM